MGVPRGEGCQVFEVVAGRYVLIDSIGSGGSGEVWRAFDRKRGAYCAAKVIRNPEAATLVRAVFEQGVRLDHPHVVTPYAWAADDEQVLLAMPLVRGGSLAVLLQDLGVLPARYGAEVLRQLLVALEHVHAAGLVHRDVKPANVLLEPTGTGAPHARLADFGLVLTPDRPRITGTYMVVGTRDYLAPESLEYGDQGVAQDLYAAGLVGAEMVGAGAVDAAAAGAGTDGASAERLAELLAALTDPEPGRRPESATAALERLAEVLDGWPLRTPAPMPESDEPVEVFEQIGPLPPGWGPQGPIAEADTVMMEWLWAPDPVEGTRPAVQGGSVESMQTQTRPLESMPGAHQRTIPVGGAAGGAVAGMAGGVGGGAAGGAVGTAGGLARGVAGSPAGGSTGSSAGGAVGGSAGGGQAQGPQSSDAPGSWQTRTVPLGGGSGGAPGDRQPESPQPAGPPAGWQGQTVQLGSGSGGAIAGRHPQGPQSSSPQPTSPPAGWQAQTVQLGSGSGGAARQAPGAPGDWQARTVRLGNNSSGTGGPSATSASSSAPAGRPVWPQSPAEPDIDRVRLMPVPFANTGAVPAGAVPTAAPPVSRLPWRWAAIVAAVVAVAVVVLVVAFR